MQQIKVVKMYDDVKLPEYATPGSACFDIYAHSERPTEPSYENITYNTGLQFEIPEGNVMLIFSRSGDGFKKNTRLANCVGVIDSDYRGELAVKLTRDDGKCVEYSVGERVAQGMVIPVNQVSFEVVNELSPTQRGNGGFGSTGKE